MKVLLSTLKPGDRFRFAPPHDAEVHVYDGPGVAEMAGTFRVTVADRNEAGDVADQEVTPCR